MIDESTVSFKNLLQKVAAEKNKRIDTAFVWWYTETKFGKNCDIHVTDGSSDGGIDAVVFDDDLAYVIQSEFCGDLFQGKRPSALSPKKYSQFDSTVNIFKNRKNFEEYLGTVDNSLHALYRKVAQKFQRDPAKVIWEITTLHSPSSSGEKRLENIDYQNLHYHDYNFRLFQLSLEGATPLAKPLELNFDQHFIVDDSLLGIKSYIARADLKDFIDYVDRDPNFNIISRNVRNEIRGSEVNPAIRETYLDDPEEFWYSHNGMTIICESASIRGNKILLKGPNIINGAQTIHAVKYQKKRDPKAKVLVRVIELPSESEDTKKFINKVIFRTNQQNKIFTYDLKANDPLQVGLARKYLQYKIFYDRRRGDWDLNKREYKNEGLERFKSTDLAKILIACEYSLGGVITAKKDIEALFTDKYYYRIFDKPFEEIFFKHVLFYSVKECLRQIRSKRIKPRLRNTALFTCFAIVWECLETYKNLRNLYEIGKVDPYKLDPYYNRRSGDFIKTVQMLFKDCWNKWKIENRKVETLRPTDFFNKSKKWNLHLRKKFVPKYRHRIQRSVERMIE